MIDMLKHLMTKIYAAKQWVSSIVEEPEVGKIYADKRAVSVLDFGAFVHIMPGKGDAKRGR